MKLKGLICTLLMVCSGAFGDGARSSRIVSNNGSNVVQNIPGDIKVKLSAALTNSSAAIKRIQQLSGEQKNRLGLVISTNGLVSYWKLDEATGARNDSIGGYHLTAVNTPGSVVGALANGVLTDQSDGSYLTHGDGPAIPSADFTWGAWFRGDLGGKIDHGWTSSGFPGIRLAYVSGTSLATLTIIDTLTLSTTQTGVGGWNLVVGVRSGNTYKISINGGDFSTTNLVTSPRMDLAYLYFGASADAEEVVTSVDAGIDEAFFMTRSVSQEEVYKLWNAGAALSYPWGNK